MKEYIKAIAECDLHDLLTPYAFCIAIELAAKQWNIKATMAYGTELRDRVKELARQLKELETK